MNASTDRSHAAQPGSPPRWFRRVWVRGLLGGLGTGLGLLGTLLVATVGHCSAFGGRCPATPPPLVEDDVFGGTAIGLSLVVVSVVLALRPTRRSLLLAAGGVALVALPLAHTLTLAAHRG